jgi:hypothetical protein
LSCGSRCNQPEVTIYQTNSGCRRKGEDEDETILVKRVK